MRAVGPDLKGQLDVVVHYHRHAELTAQSYYRRRLVARALLAAVLHARHAAFQAMLQTNLTVLATAHAVSEGIIRGVSGELSRRQAPTTYGASGRANAPSPKASQPLALSRTL
jgi:hypothetical protein